MNHENKKSPWHILFARSTVKILIISLSLAYVSFFIMWEADHSRALEPKPTVLHLDQKELNRSSQVEVGMYINNFQTFSIQRNEFTMDAVVWFKFPGGSESMQTIEDFSIKNSFILNSGQTIYKYPPIIKVIGNDVVINYNILVTFKTNLVYTNFPLGNHMINIQVQNRSVNPYELSFVSKNENLAIDTDFKYILDDWIPISYTVDTGYAKSLISSQNNALDISYPVALFSIEFTNIGHRDVLAIYFPMLVLFLIGLFCLLLDITDPSRLSYVATAIPILVLFRMVIDSISPQTSYMTHLDYMYYTVVLLSLLLTLFQAFLSFIIHAFQLNEQKISENMRRKLTILNDMVFFVILALLVILTTYSYFR